MRDAIDIRNIWPNWVNLKTRKNTFGDNKNKPGLKNEHEEALLMDEARTDYLNQKAKDETTERIGD